ncbi:MAG: hypothetical protein R3E36_01805 [Nitrosomonas sp.]|nr:hypothetical protein [Burkholderiales bacterium]MDR4519336.1 hypothetical protein [Nitrosomonas sp.]
MEIISNVIDTVAVVHTRISLLAGVADTQLHHIAIAVVTNRRFAAIFYSLHRQAKIRMPVSRDLAFDKVDRKKNHEPPGSRYCVISLVFLFLNYFLIDAPLRSTHPTGLF